MKQKTGKKTGGRKKVIVIILAMVLVLILVGGVLLWLLQGKRTQTMDTQWQQQGSFFSESTLGDMVSAYGVTSIGMTEATFPITNLENSLEIEEVYISSGESITEETALFKMTEESLATVRTELEEDLRAADLAYRAGAIEYEQSKITAYYERENTLLSSAQADEVYKETTDGLYENVQRAKEELDEAKAEIAEYEAAIAGNTYYEDYQVAHYKAIYDENLEILKKKMEEWGVSWSEVTSGRTSSNTSSVGGNMSEVPGGSMEESMGGGMMRSLQLDTVSGGNSEAQQSANPHSQYVTVLSSLYKILEQNLADYEQAYAGYEDATENAGFELQTLKLALSSLEQKYTEALESYENNILQAELTKETTLSNGEKAESIYEADIEKAEADLEELQEAKEEAQNNLELFEKYIVDGCFYGSESGSLLRVNIRAGERIGSENRLYTISNVEEITVTVSVSQTDIAKRKVGDTAMVQSTESGMYNGVITAINPISASESKASVTYSVTVAVEEAAENLSANETVVVYFGMENGARKNED